MTTPKDPSPATQEAFIKWRIAEINWCIAEGARLERAGRPRQQINLALMHLVGLPDSVKALKKAWEVASGLSGGTAAKARAVRP